MRCVVPSLLLCAMALVPLRSAIAGGSPSLHVKELSTKGAASPVAYLQALNRRGPMLATCYGSKEALTNAAPIEAFLEVGLDGVPAAVNVTNVDDPANGDLAACLLKQLDKVRFPVAEGPVEVKAVLGPAPAEEDEEPKR